MRRELVAVIVALGMLVSSCGLKLPSESDLPTQLTGGEPKTLDAATKATQEYADRRAAGDYAGVWLMYDKQIQDGISQTDYVAVSQTCKSNLEKIPVTATGVRMEDDTHALVRIKPLGISVQLPVVYENGKWLMAPSDEFAAELGKPVGQIIAGRKAAKNCGDEDLSSRLATPTPTVPPTTPSPQLRPSSPVRMPATSDVREDRAGDGHLVGVQLAANDGFDRLILEFADQVPSYTVGYRPLPARADASGEEILLPGATAAVQISLHPASGDGTYSGPSDVKADTAMVTEAKAAGDFESVLTWVAGVRSEVPFSVLVFDGPPRLVIDFKH